MTLAELAPRVKQILIWISIFLIFLIVLRFAWFVGKAGFGALFGQKEDTQTIRFGTLERPPLPTNKLSVSQLEISLDTPESSLPQTPELLNVYEIQRGSAVLLSIERASGKARSSQVKGNPKKITPTIYKITDTENANRSFTYYLEEDSFLYLYDWKKDSSVLSDNFIYNNEAAIREAKSSLSRISQLPEDLENGKTKLTFLKISPKNQKIVSSFFEANAVRIDFLRADLNNTPIVYQNPSSTPISVTLSPNLQEKILEIRHHYNVVNKDNFSPYPIKKSSDAWEELKKGDSYLALPEKTNLKSFSIRKIYLAYLDSSKQLSFFQPVFVFEGKGVDINGNRVDVLSYVPAIISKHIGN
ncbi:MAG: hypothetical protein A2134_00465 [Candidatus Woykebacteria bacterium RBG_16_39_9b]|uniref:Uncharacterized protein n=1 Tax=Candidatus Woykebacteria bacterium RBG_16_39_9b TaxID=1802595 RepID=A0A1G1WBD8_9BACT|nr:MAG: hypothetical protein A2134_00465 [Candidatus Woykebacteria bacterium RBG_16_39_9b]